MPREYRHIPGYEPEVKPLAELRERLQWARSPADYEDARRDFLVGVYWKWRGTTALIRHWSKIHLMAYRESRKASGESNDRTAA